MPTQPKYGWLTREILDELYHEYLMSAEKIAAALHIPSSTVLHYMRQFGIACRTPMRAYRAHYEFAARYGAEWVSASQEIGEQVLRTHACDEAGRPPHFA